MGQPGGRSPKWKHDGFIKSFLISARTGSTSSGLGNVGRDDGVYRTRSFA
jgi:hypothetical protein